MHKTIATVAIPTSLLVVYSVTAAGAAVLALAVALNGLGHAIHRMRRPR